MFFKDVIGQDGLKQQLIAVAQKGVVPHAQLFCGKAVTQWETEWIAIESVIRTKNLLRAQKKQTVS